MRHSRITAAIALCLLVSLPAVAASVSMANGSVSFDTPANWMAIMQTSGDPEVQVFQVPDASPTGQTALARVTVTVKQEPDASGFDAWVGQGTAHAAALPGYQVGASSAAAHSYRYTAREAGVDSSYREIYWYRNGHAIQLRCVRPKQTQAGAAWIAAFDRGCEALAKQLQ